MFKLRKREDYLNPSTTVTQLDLEYSSLATGSDIRFDASVEDYNAVEGTAPEEGEVDYLS